MLLISTVDVSNDNQIIWLKTPSAVLRLTWTDELQSSITPETAGSVRDVLIEQLIWTKPEIWGRLLVELMSNCSLCPHEDLLLIKNYSLMLKEITSRQENNIIFLVQVLWCYWGASLCVMWAQTLTLKYLYSTSLKSSESQRSSLIYSCGPIRGILRLRSKLLLSSFNRFCEKCFKWRKAAQHSGEKQWSAEGLVAVMDHRLYSVWNRYTLKCYTHRQEVTKYIYSHTKAQNLTCSAFVSLEAVLLFHHCERKYCNFYSTTST